MHENWNMKKGLHAGFEMGWKMFSWWNGTWSVGTNQGYLTAGVGAEMGFFRLDIVSWAEEAGTSSTPIESRRMMVEMSLDF